MLKSFIHKTFQKFGYDVVASVNLETEVDRRIEARQRFQLAELARLRELRKQRPRLPQSGTMVEVSRGMLMETAGAAMLDVNCLLDIGCAFRPQQIFSACIHICCEPFHEYMDRLLDETRGQNKFVYLNQNIEEVCESFPQKSVDSAYLCDVIEHIDRDVAKSCIDRLQKIVRKQLILFTPLGFMPQDPDELNAGTDPWGMGGMEWQKHRSGWTPEDFPVLEGWTVFFSSDFHQEDGYGRPLQKPFGAMWAIWNAPGVEENHS